MSKLNDFMKQNFPTIGKMVMFALKSDKLGTKDLIKEMLTTFDKRNLVSFHQELIRKEISYEVLDSKGKPVVVTANLLSEFAVILSRVKEEPLDPRILDLFLTLEETAVQIETDVQDILDCQINLEQCKNEILAISDELETFIRNNLKMMKGYSLHRLRTEFLPKECPQLERIISIIETNRRTLYMQVAGTGVSSTDAITHLDKFVKIYKAVVSLNIQNALISFSDDAIAIKAWKQVYSMREMKNYKNFASEDILEESSVFKLIPETV